LNSDNEYCKNLLGRWFPWTDQEPNTGISSKAEHHKLVNPQPKNQIASPQTQNRITSSSNTNQNVDTSKKGEKLEKKHQLQSLTELVGNEIHNSSFDVSKQPSVLEMWNFLESTGIKRQLVDKVFTTEEAVRELYNTVYTRVHYEREQEMIKRLRAYVEKLQSQNILTKQK
jgi:hypothetical protein